MYQDDLSADGLVAHFGWEPNPPEKTPFRDERVRQALSMSWDRDQYIDTFFNVSKFRAEGLPVETAWNTVFGADLPFTGWWLDPKSSDFGENAKYFQHNIAEAKKLLSAAGNPNPQALSTQRSADSDQITVLEGMASEAGFRFTTNVVNQTEYVRVRDSQGKFEGIAYRGLPSGSSSGGADNLEFLIRSFSIKLGGRNYSGFDANGRGDFSGDQYLEDMFAKGRGEADVNKRKALVHEAQRYLAKKMYSIRWPGGASGFLLRWPAVKNVGVFKDDLRGDDMTLWLDPSQPPLSSS
jgi:ABC-type transport system substrate-binding protein